MSITKEENAENLKQYRPELYADIMKQLERLKAYQSAKASLSNGTKQKPVDPIIVDAEEKEEDVTLAEANEILYEAEMLRFQMEGADTQTPIEEYIDVVIGSKSPQVQEEVEKILEEFYHEMTPDVQVPEQGSMKL